MSIVEIGIERNTSVDGLVGDLRSFPDPSRKYFTQYVQALMEIRDKFGKDADGADIESLIREQIEIARVELSRANTFIDQQIKDQVSHQLRTRPDSAHGKLAVEQWIPALKFWIVCGYYEFGTPASKIIADLKKGDPTKKTATEELNERREAASATRARNEAAGDQKVLDVINSLGDKRVDQFVSVEQALHTGENITVRGDDRRTIEKLVAGTRDAAEHGDKEAQAVMTHGQKDNKTCILPSTNPFRHRHRKELIDGSRKRRK